MKSYIFYITSCLLFLTACSAQYQTKNYDDVYYSARNKQADDRSFVVKPTKVEPSQNAQAEQQPQAEQPARELSNQYNSEQGTTGSNNSDSTQYTTPEGDPNVANNYYGDDYYDYAYSARLRRFQNNPYYNNYYSDYYTNSYWYDNNPWDWGRSIYMGYNWLHPSFYASWSWPYYSWGFGFNGWEDPYFGWGSYAYGFNLGYWNGYYDSYWNGNGHYYYNSHDDNTHFYGRRHTVGSSGSIVQNSRDLSFAERYENRIADERNGNRITERNSSNVNNGRTSMDGNSRNNEAIQAGTNSTNTTDELSQNSLRNSQGGVNNNPVNPRNSGVNGPGSNQTGMRNSRESNSNNNQDVTRHSEINQVIPAPSNGQRIRNTNQTGTQKTMANNTSQRPTRYTYQGTRSESHTQSPQNLKNRGKVQPYSSPAYTKPHSGQEYTAPKYRNTKPANEYQHSNRGSSNNGVQSPSHQGNRSNNEPSNNSYRNSRPSNTPQRTYEIRSAPNRSNDHPARSNNSYSAPGRSIDYSSPSRSNNSSSTSRSSESSSPSRSSGSSTSGSSSSGSGHRR